MQPWKRFYELQISVKGEKDAGRTAGPFQAMLEEKGERLILDEYLPKNGTYRLLFLTESGYWIGDTLEIQYDRKEGKIAGSESKYYDLICYLDYWSKLIDMNKPVDSKKVIHSNQYLSFFVKKDSISGEKLTDEVINGYFDVLKSRRKNIKREKRGNCMEA